MIAKRHNGQVKSRLSIRESGVCLGSEENVELVAKHFDRPAFIVRRHHKNDFRFLTIVFASKQIHRLWVESSGGQKPFDHYCHPIFIVSSPHMHAHKNNFFLKKSDLIFIRYFNQNLDCCDNFDQKIRLVNILGILEVSCHTYCCNLKVIMRLFFLNKIEMHILSITHWKKTKTCKPLYFPSNCFWCLSENVLRQLWHLDRKWTPLE